MGSQVTRFMDFLPANFQTAKLLRTQPGVRHGTDVTDEPMGRGGAGRGGAGHNKLASAKVDAKIKRQHCLHRAIMSQQLTGMR